MNTFWRIACLLGMLIGCAAAPRPQSVQSELPLGITPYLAQTLPVDRLVRIGTLENGLRYYIRHNQKPEGRLELWLVVKAGSVLEEEGQQGLAHFVEHMAFNGTEHFAHQELVDYLESIGMAFGPEVNAYTGFDETAFMLQVPADSIGVLETAFQILEDWAGRIAFEDEEIDKERGVVIEEWRLGRGAGARLRDRQLPVLLRGSRYAERLPIGQPAVLDTFHYQTLRDFYHTWYRPELMAVIAVGDADPRWVEEQIRTCFSRLPVPQNPRPRPRFPVPDHEESLFAIAADPEVTRAEISIYYKREVRDQQTVGAYRQHLVEALYHRLLNQRLHELTLRADPPFLYAHSAQGLLVQTKEGCVLRCGVREDGLLRGLEALLSEVQRVRLYGFTAAELERQKKEMLRLIEQAYRERDKTESRLFAEEYTRNFLEDEPIPGIEYEWGLYQTFVPEIALAEVNQVAAQWTGQANRVIAVSMPQKEGVAIPTEEELREIFARVEAMPLEPYPEEGLGQSLLRELPEPAAIVATREFPEIEVTEWTLANGVKVVLKPTDFKNDEVIFSAASPGGHSLVSDQEYIAALTADALVRASGVGAFDRIALEKMLAGKMVSISPWINALEEGLRGRASRQDLETLFQLIYLYVTAPRQDSTAFLAYQIKLEGMIENRSASPEAAFSDTLQVTLTQHHFRARPWSKALLKEMDLATSLRVYRERFGDAGDFTFFFVGSFDLEEIGPLVQRYLGALPSAGRQERWRDVGLEPPRGVVERRVYQGMEEKSLSQLVFTGPFAWSYRNNYEIHSLAGALQFELREVLREELGGTYGVGVEVSTTLYPRPEYSLSIAFGCAPDRVEELTRVVFAQIDSLARFGPDSSLVQKVQETQRRNRQVDLRENSFWVEVLEIAYFYDLDPRIILEDEEWMKRLDRGTLQRAAQQYLNPKNYVRVVLLPERYKTEKNQ